MSYVEKNLRNSETVQQKCHVTWMALIPIILRSVIVIALGWIFALVLAALIVDRRMPYYTANGLDYFASEEYGNLDIGLTIFVIAVILISIIIAVIPIIKLLCIELVVTDKKLIGKTGIIYSNAIDVYLEKIDNFVIDETLMGRIFKYATITVGTASVTLRFPYMQNAVEFKNKVMDQYDARRTALMKEQADLIKS